ncbi:Structural maintenance of chromosomes protein 5 [Tetrabaena socialis]|uniref:Structural maintenance of chromosomes protein 5 n=1 Tax=Tetrabaena socialis TaxID=47790 RepID=A0A2J8A6L9_9CHLO|nr:Structural maintenance of chromosomes protein 5 [Tetrabaena socialis]|eukprot:PNH08147.1 Structural maintenance of chromosomes protein 5 [Tetrabaena socialis]
MLDPQPASPASKSSLPRAPPSRTHDPRPYETPPALPPPLYTELRQSRGVALRPLVGARGAAAAAAGSSAAVRQLAGSTVRWILRSRRGLYDERERGGEAAGEELAEPEGGAGLATRAKPLESATSAAQSFWKSCLGTQPSSRLALSAEAKKWTVLRAVQFRAHEGMQLLTKDRQSGGERSTSTILYLIALQGVTSTPFRVVDEINQGMDSTNERKVFKLLVAASTEADTPQCFLVTPKLLPGLEYTRDVEVLHIMNGPSIEDGLSAKFNMEEGFFGSRFRNVRARHAES